MSSSLAPVALFAFNRPAHTARTLAALAASPLAAGSDVYAFLDGPRHDDERARVDDVRAVLADAAGFARVRVHATEANRGLFASLTEGIGKVLAVHQAVIVVEDDIEVAPGFLGYMNSALDRYRDVAAVGSIHGYSPPIAGLPKRYFLRGGDCWGWATWADRWSLFNPDARELLLQLRRRRALRAFMRSHGAAPLLQLVKRARGRNQSWATLWHASLFLADRYTLHPGTSLVANIGCDGSGTHSRREELAHAQWPQRLDAPLPGQVTEDAEAARRLSRYLDRGAAGRVPIPGWVLRGYALALARIEAGRRGAAR